MGVSGAERDWVGVSGAESEWVGVSGAERCLGGCVWG